MAVLIDVEKTNSEEYPTLFGFTTKNGFASKSLNFVYLIVMVVAIAFAFHALSLILSDWNSGLIFLAALSVVGLPYCIKIIMYGKKVFEYKHAVLCILISLLPTIFDFVGFYSETSIKESLMSKKFEVLEVVNYFDQQARSDLNEKILNLENELNKNLTEKEQLFNLELKNIKDASNKIQSDIEKKINTQNKDLNQKINDAQQKLIDETEGINGKAGIGPKAKELEAELRKTEANVEIERKEILENNKKEIEKISNNLELEKKTLEENHLKDIDKIKKENDTKKKSIQDGINAIDELLGDKGLIFEVNKANNFTELADVSIKLNTSINTISSKIGTEPKYVKFESDNVIKLSFNALLKGDITAIICFLLAILLEVVDTIIVYMVRGVKPDKVKNKEEILESKIRERKYYDY
jgi:hypothetical protein